jgi:flagellar export protein FliJ
MAVSHAMRRLLRVREIEEERSHTALESALAELSRLEAALQSAAERGRRGRRWIASSAGSCETIDRLAGLEESRSAQRHAAVLAPRILEAVAAVESSRVQYLGKRIERRQVEMLLEQAEAREAAAANRRTQQQLDHWFLNSSRRARKPTPPSDRQPHDPLE